jgi:hypothetical protein
VHVKRLIAVLGLAGFIVMAVPVPVQKVGMGATHDETAPQRSAS